MSGFGSLHTAAAMNKVIRNAAVQEVNRVRPEPRTARVVEIGEGHCLVTYTGEDTVVKVPYNNLAPSYVGQVVLIDGPMGDRRIVEVMGRTSFEGRIESVENFSFSPPLWFQSMMEYPETYPVVLTNNSVELGTTWVNASPMVAPRDTDVVRVEIRLVTAMSGNIKMSLYRVNDIFSVINHVQTATVSSNNLSPGFTLDTPLHVKRDEIICVVVSKVGSTGDPLLAHGLKHPDLPLSREGQFTMGNFDPVYQGNTVTSDLITPRNNRFTMWAIALPYIV